MFRFYFKIKNRKKVKNVKLNIVNFTRSNSLYERGLKPYIKFKAKNKKYYWMQYD